jgi:hypothetical protein
MTKSFGPVYTQPDNLNEIETSEIFNHTDGGDSTQNMC